jgi:hypothetical protein
MIELGAQRRLPQALAIARREAVELTTPQP